MDGDMESASCHVNTQLLPIKLFYFFYYGAVSCITPFLPHILQQNKGLSPVQVTTILGVIRFFAVVTKPIAGNIADSTQNYRRTAFCTLLIGLFSTLLIPVLPRLTAITQQENNASGAADVDGFVIGQFAPSEFWLALLVLFVSYSVGMSTSYTLIDALTLKLLRERTKDYGRQRMWMVFGSAFALLAVSLAMDRLSVGKSRVQYWPCFAGFTLLLSGSLFTVYATKEPAGAGALVLAQTSESRQGGLARIAPELLLRPRRFLFLLMAVLCGMNFGQSIWMMPFYLKVDLHSSQLVIGCAFISVCVSSVLAFRVAGRLIELIGHELALSVCLGIYGLRSLLWCWLSHRWASVAVEGLFGLAAGLWLPTMGSYASRIGGKSNKASAQAILSAAFDGLGVGLGNLISGWVYQTYGGRFTWKLYSGWTLSVAALYVLILLVRRLVYKRSWWCYGDGEQKLSSSAESTPAVSVQSSVIADRHSVLLSGDNPKAQAV